MSEEARTVHLVHHDSDVLLSLYEVLSASGFQVAASSNTLDALAYIARSRPQAVLCRWKMPQMEAPEFIRRVKAVSPLTRIIICSEQADGEKYRQLTSLGASDLIPEPVRASVIREAFMRSTGLGVPYEPEQEIRSFDLDAPLPVRPNKEVRE